MRPVLLLVVAASMLFSQKLVIEAGTVIDGRGDVLRNKQITIEDSKIVSIDDGKAPVNVDLRKYTVMPGWIDTHVHLEWHFGPDGKIVRQHNEKPEQVVLYDAEDAWLTLQGGFTTLQSVGSRPDGFVRDRINGGYLPGPRILTSLIQITDKSGNPEQLRHSFGRPKPKEQISSSYLRRRVSAQAAARP